MKEITGGDVRTLISYLEGGILLLNNSAEPHVDILGLVNFFYDILILYSHMRYQDWSVSFNVGYKTWLPDMVQECYKDITSV